MSDWSWRLSKAEYLSEFFLVPLYAALALIAAFMLATPTAEWFAIFVGGAGVWTLTEYWMHRVVYHKLYRREHGLHHIRPLDWIGASPFITGACFFLLWLLLVQSLGGVGRGGAAFAGFISGYYGYIVIHVLIHHTSTALVASQRTTHEIHHALASKNFGVTTNVWDKVFGTFKRPA